MRIGLDFDGVITDCGELKSAAAMTLYGRTIPAAKFKREIVMREGLLTALEYKTLQKFVYESEYGYSMKPVDGMLEYLPRLMTEHDVRIVTCRDDKSEEVARGWLRHHAPHINTPLIGVGKTSKAPACAGLDIFVDDDLDKLENLVGVVPHRYLMGWEYNRDARTDGIASRINSWQQLYNTVQSIKARDEKEKGG